jgi:tRNA A-37 threonylcarbamoyl transferase component Bud32
VGHLPYQKISRGEIKGWLREDLFQILPASFYDDPESYIRRGMGETVKESRYRWAAVLRLSNEKSLFFKKDKTKGWLETLKYFLLPSKARKEWFIAYQLQKMNLSVPKPYGWLERVRRGKVVESYYLAEGIGRGNSLIDETAILKDENHLKKLATTVLRFHRSGLFHQDLHAGNFLWDGDSFYLIDLHRAKILSSLSIGQRLWNLSHLFHSLRSIWTEREHSAFMEAYFEGEPLSSQSKEEYLRKIHTQMDRLQKRQWRSRTKRCLKESTEFSVTQEPGKCIYHLKEFSLERLNRALQNHHTLLRENPMRLLKQSPEVVVSISEERENRICIKQFRHSRLLDSLKDCFRTSKGLKAWISGNGLRARGIDSLKVFALIKKKCGWGREESYLVMEVLQNGREMDRYIFGGWKDVRKKRAFIRAFARWLSDLHQRDLYHQDMKTCNLVVLEYEKGWNFYLIDLEDILLDEWVDERKLFDNFLQINTSVPRIFSRTDRLRFYREYQQHRPTVKEDRPFLARLMKKSRERGIVYVSPNGVVKETSC